MRAENRARFMSNLRFTDEHISITSNAIFSPSRSQSSHNTSISALRASFFKAWMMDFVFYTDCSQMKSVLVYLSNKLHYWYSKELDWTTAPPGPVLLFHINFHNMASYRCKAHLPNVSIHCNLKIMDGMIF